MTRFPLPEIAAAAAFAVLFAVWYPPVPGVIDESDYLSMAYVFRAGTIDAAAGVDTVSRIETEGRAVTKFAPLWPAFLVPFTLPGWRGAFAGNLVLHLAGFALFAALVRREGLPRWTALLWLVHPTLVYHARTLLSDTAAGVLFLAAWLAWRRGDRTGAAAAGLATGASCLVRYTNVVLAGLLVLGAIVADAVDAARRGRGAERRPARTPALLAGMVPPAVLLALYNQAAFGAWWRGTAGYRDERAGLGMEGQFRWEHVPGNLLHDGAALFLLYPLMPLALAAVRGRDRVPLLVTALGFPLFFLFYYYRDDGGDVLSDAVVGLRFLVPVLPLYLAAYAAALGHWAPRVRVPRRLAGAVLAGAAVVGTGLLHERHDAFLRGVEADRDALLAHTPDDAVILCDTGARKLVHFAWGGRRQAERVEFRGRWEFPPLSDLGAPAWIAAAGRGAAPETPPALDAAIVRSGAEPVEVEGARTLRLWKVPVSAR